VCVAVVRAQRRTDAYGQVPPHLPTARGTQEHACCPATGHQLPDWLTVRFGEHDLDERPDDVVGAVARALTVAGWRPPVVPTTPRERSAVTSARRADQAAAQPS